MVPCLIPLQQLHNLTLLPLHKIHKIMFTIRKIGANPPPFNDDMQFID